MNTFDSKTQSLMNKVIRNFSFLMSGKIFGDICIFFLFVTISRLFGQDGIGQYSFAIAYTGFFMIFADFGLYDLSVKDISRNKDDLDRYYGEIISIRILCSSLITSVLMLSLLALPFSSEYKILIGLIGLYQIFYTILDGLYAIFVAFEDMQYAGLLDFLLKAAISAIGITLCIVKFELYMVVSIFPTITIVFIIIAYLIVIKKYGKIHFSSSISSMKRKIQEAVPYMLSLLLSQTTTRLDVVLLGFLLGSAAAGVYNAAYRIVFLLLFVPHFISISIFPAASQFFIASSKDKILKLYRNTLNWIVLIGLPASTGLCLIAPDLIDLIFGDSFIESVILLRLLSWLFLLACFKSILAILLTACDRQKIRTQCQTYATLVCVVLNAALISIFGVIGAAVAMIISEGFLVILLLLKIKSFLGWPHISKRFIISGLSCVSFCIPLITLFELPMIIEIIFAIIIYSGVLFSFKTIRRDEFKTFHKLFKNALGT